LPPASRQIRGGRKPRLATVGPQRLSPAFILQSRFEQDQQLLLLPETRNLFLANSPPTLFLNNIAYNLSPLFPYVFNYFKKTCDILSAFCRAS